MFSAAHKQSSHTDDVKVIIGPHAGIRFSGPTAAQAYCQLNPDTVKRVVIIGPSHHVHYPNCVLSTATHFDSPLGRVVVDTDTVDALIDDRDFSYMDRNEDEEEHSIEMHLPFLQYVMGPRRSYSIVPIVVGALSARSEARCGKRLAELLAQEGTVVAISSDFCHWGARFRYQHYDAAHGPVHQSIEWLDKLGMQHIEAQDPDAFGEYLEKYRNTICGRHAIQAIMHAMRLTDSSYSTRFVGYAQSSQCMSMSDSSVSYAAGYTVRVASE